MDNPFDTPVTGQADWDSGLGANFQALERGYHVTERAGVAVNTGMLLALNSGGFFFPWTNTGSNFPHAMSYTAALSGETLTALTWGIMRSLDINSVTFPGAPLYGSVATPGLIVTSPVGPVIGVGLTGRGVLFNPSKAAGGGGGGGGVTMVQSLTDVDPAGLANGSIMKWSNTSSKFTMQVDSGGGGGGTYLYAAPTPAAGSFASTPYRFRGNVLRLIVPITIDQIYASVNPTLINANFQAHLLSLTNSLVVQSVFNSNTVAGAAGTMTFSLAPVTITVSQYWGVGFSNVSSPASNAALTNNANAYIGLPTDYGFAASNNYIRVDTIPTVGTVLDNSTGAGFFNMIRFKY